MNRKTYRRNSHLATKKSKKILPIILIVIFFVYVLLTCFLPIKNIQPTISFKPNINNPYPSLSLPSQGSSLVYSDGFGDLAANNANDKRPIASITKIITALTVLQAKPLQAGEQGPIITLTEKDAQIFEHYTSINGSTALAPVGLKITESDALTAMLLPSANNYADTLATWAYGSQENFVTAANKFLQSKNLNDSSLADASGFSPDSKSSANDLVILGKMVLDNPVLKSIVFKKSANIPGIGEVKNTNFLLNNPNVIGIKTGNTDEAKKCLLFASKYKIGEQEITVISVTLGQETFLDLANNTQTMLLNTEKSFNFSNFVDKNQIMGELKTPWGETINIIAADGLKVVTWQNVVPKYHISTKQVKSNQQDLNIGTLNVKSGTKDESVNLKLANKIKGPSLMWRITHPQNVF